MDTISQAIASLRVGRGTVRRFRESGAWGMRFSGLTGSGFHVVLQGQGWLSTADGPPTPLRPGDVVVIPAGADHGISCARRAIRDLPPLAISPGPPAAGPVDLEFLCGAYRLDHGPVHPYLSGMPELIVLSPDYEQNPELRSVIGLLGGDETGPGAEVTRTALLDLMLVHVLRQWFDEQGTERWPTISDPAITAALSRIHDRPQVPWTVSQLSAMAGLSRSAFTRRFTSLVGRPPMAYLIGWRLGCAARLLRETDASLAEIARRVGYSSEFAFAAAFRREYGRSPGRFRVASGRTPGPKKSLAGPVVERRARSSPS